MSNDKTIREKAITFDLMMDALSDLIVKKLERDYVLVPRGNSDDLKKLLKFCCHRSGIAYEDYQANKSSTDRVFIPIKEMVSYLYKRVIPYYLQDRDVASLLGIDRTSVIHHRRKIEGLCKVDEKERKYYEELIEEYNK